MTSPSLTMSDRLWERAARRIENAKPDIDKIENLGEEAVAAAAREAIRHHRGADLYWDLSLLALLHRRAIPHLVDDLVALTTFDRHVGQVHDLLSRMDRADIEKLVPPAVHRLLDRAEFDDLLRFGVLLKRLTLHDALHDLVAFTSASPDEEIRTIGPEWFPDHVA